MKTIIKLLSIFFVFLMFSCSSDDPGNANENEQTPPEEEVPEDEDEDEDEDEEVAPKTDAFVHPGALITEESLQRMRNKIEAQASPWHDNYDQLINHPERMGTLDYTPSPQKVLCRGGACGRDAGLENYSENYVSYSRDIQAAFELALIYLLDGDTAYADKAVDILNAWADELEMITGDSNQSLLAGNMGYQFAVVGEMLRDYEGWNAADQEEYKAMLTDIVYPRSLDFLDRHHGTCDSHYRSNWDVVNMASVMAIGIYTDNLDMFNYVVDYYQNGPASGNIHNLVHTLYDNPAEEGPDQIGQTEEAGRDQPHNMSAIGWMALVTEMAWNQGVDLYGYDDNRFLKGAEYVARYNLNMDVPYTRYKRCTPNADWEEVVSEDGRGGMFPIWEPIYNHYINRQGLEAPYVELKTQQLRPELPNYIIRDSKCCSWAFETFGYGTLLYLEE